MGFINGATGATQTHEESTSIRGEAGPPGPAGARGPKGEKGEKGDIGDFSTANITGDIVMNDHAIKQLANPVGDQDAVNLTSMKKYVGSSAITTGHAHKKNDLGFLTQRVGVSAVNNISSVTVEDFTSNLHSVNKKAYTFNIIKTSNNSFNSRLALNKTSLKEGEYTICVEFFYPKNKNDQNWFLNPLNKLASSTITYHTKRFATHNPPYIRIIFNTYKLKDKNDDTIYFDILNPGYDGSAPSEKAALIIYGVKGYQSDIDGIIYDDVFFLDSSGDFTLQTNLDMNYFKIKNYDPPGYTIVNDKIKLQKDLDLNGYAFKAFRPKIIIPGAWDIKEQLNPPSDRKYVKFGNWWRLTVPFPCFLDGLAISSKYHDTPFEQIGVKIPIDSISHMVFKSTRNIHGINYQYVAPRLSGDRRIKLNEGDYLGMYFIGLGDNPFSSPPRIAKYAVVSLVLIDDSYYR